MMRYDKKRAYLVVGGVAGRVKEAWGPVAGGQVVYQLGRVGWCVTVHGGGCTSHASGEQDVQA